MNDKKEKVESDVRDICLICDTLMTALKSQVAMGVQNMDTKETGEVVDMIKDLVDAKKNIYKACYYKTATESMEENPMMFAPPFVQDMMDEINYNERMGYRGGNSGGGRGNSGSSGSSGSRGGSSSSSGGNSGNSRSGYDNWRYSSGRFAPKGHGTYEGYVDMPDLNQIENDIRNEYRNGAAYHDYNKSRRYYTETHEPADKREMDEHAKKHVLETVETIREIYRASDPELRKKIKEEFTHLTNEMSV